jgi:hypothetical protein
VLLPVPGGPFGVLLGLAVSIGYALTSGWPVVLPVPAIAAGVGAPILIGTVAGWFSAARAHASQRRPARRLKPDRPAGVLLGMTSLGGAGGAVADPARVPASAPPSGSAVSRPNSRP